MAAPPLPEEGQEIEVECLRIAYGGQGIARTDTGATVMLTRAVPGEGG
jgi:predicted RNA-binding protein with TRAM domain